MRLLLVVAVLVGCGSKQPPATLSDACYELAGTLCDRIQQCGGASAQCRTVATQDCCGTADCFTPIVDCKTGKTCCATAECTRVALDLQHVSSVFDDCTAAAEALSCGQIAAGASLAKCGETAVSGP